jgi:hypothetical protein
MNVSPKMSVHALWARNASDLEVVLVGHLYGWFLRSERIARAVRYFLIVVVVGAVGRVPSPGRPSVPNAPHDLVGLDRRGGVSGHSRTGSMQKT